MNTDIQQIAQEVTTVSINELEQGIKEELRQVPISEVIYELEKFEILYDNYYQLIMSKRKAKKNNDLNIALIRQQIEQEQKVVYEQFFKFQNKFNEYFGRRIQMLFVIPENGIKLALADNDMSHVVVNKYGTLEYSIKDLSLALLQDSEYNSTILDNTANSVYHRWDIAKSKLKKSTGLPILWKTGSGWDGRKVNNRGTIAEAYANFYINKIEFSGDLESNVATYVCNDEYGMMSVDNTIGFALGDIDRGHVQYAVKSQRAGLMGMYRIRQYIKQIRKTLGTDLVDEELVNMLMTKVSQKGTVKQVKKLVEKNIEEHYNEIIDELNLTK